MVIFFYSFCFILLNVFWCWLNVGAGPLACLGCGADSPTLAMVFSDF
jgi:hypothetical protein